jgi:LacI family transcriptional regulator, fructose operon transcriptional repressor
MVSRSNGRKITIYDVAVAADTSPTTVSLVLNDAWQRYRIKPETAARILDHAERVGYSVNLKARGLRLSRSGLAGMILPHYRNRFFAGLAEAFQGEARRRGLCPIVVSTHRHPGNEVKVTEILLAQQVEFLFIAGVRNPDPLNKLCRGADVRCINIDLPGSGAPSVVSDNRGGAQQLTEVVLQKLAAREADQTDIFFFGGVADDDTTRNRVLGYKTALAARGIIQGPDAIDCCGYPPSHAARSLEARYAKLGRLPAGLFANGVTAMEGALRFTSTLPASAWRSLVVGAFDWDPFAAYLPFDITMVRQNVEVMISEGFRLLDNYAASCEALVVVPTSFGRMGELDGAQEDWNDAGRVNSQDEMYPAPRFSRGAAPRQRRLTSAKSARVSVRSKRA